jgi:hypothetical protein
VIVENTACIWVLETTLFCVSNSYLNVSYVDCVTAQVVSTRLLTWFAFSSVLAGLVVNRVTLDMFHSVSFGFSASTVPTLLNIHSYIIWEWTLDHLAAQFPKKQSYPIAQIITMYDDVMPVSYRPNHHIFSWNTGRNFTNSFLYSYTLFTLHQPYNVFCISGERYVRDYSHLIIILSCSYKTLLK